MNVFITSAYPYDSQHNFASEWLRESAASDPYNVHSVSDDPHKADIILFVEHHPPHDPYFFQVLKSSLYKEFKDKCYLYHDSDKVLPLLPGIFPSIEKSYYHPIAMEPGPYIARLCNNDAVKYLENKPEQKYLFSFAGASKSHPIRKKILNLKYEKAFLLDTTGLNSWELDPENKRAFESKYVEVSLHSQFVLCPRGIGPNSYRLYETMEMGIAPVIISDEWIPSLGPSWNSFSIIIPESQIDLIPSILEARQSEAAEMGRKAREAWEKWFSKEVCFHHIAESCQRLHQSRSKINSTYWLRMYSQFFRPYHFRNLLRFTKNQLKQHSTQEVQMS
ncbi:exostosin domain-containing protein [Sabulibacter ruber]|uniref:exostosin domain-containing protein n=1 Tax=Sabulibacter ruber TaxID=2811901 RepID=UPI001A95E651|nr:exostosin family protein [Sabulibacter ruber]